MQTITEFIVRVADLAEAEGRLLRSTSIRLAFALGIILVATGVIVAGVVLLLGAVYLAAAAWLGPAAGAALTGALALVTGGLLAWLGHRIGK